MDLNPHFGKNQNTLPQKDQETKKHDDDSHKKQPGHPEFRRI